MFNILQHFERISVSNGENARVPFEECCDNGCNEPVSPLCHIAETQNITSFYFQVSQFARTEPNNAVYGTGNGKGSTAHSALKA